MGKYKFNNDQLKFTEESFSFWDRIKKVFVWIVVLFLLISIYYIIFALFFNTDKETKLVLERKAIEAEYDRLVERDALLTEVIQDLQYRDIAIYHEIFDTDPPAILLSDSAARYQPEDVLVMIGYTNEKLGRLDESVITSNMIIDNMRKAVSDSLNKFMNIPSIIPVKNFSLGQTGATIGRKIHPFYKTMIRHTGLDIITPSGTEVIAVANGRVLKVERNDVSRGNYIVIDHQNGYKTMYAHLSDILVREGERVTRKKVIGRVGSTGISFAPHLHYEVLLEDKQMNPVNYFFAELDAKDYSEMMTIAINTGQSLD